MNQKYVILFFLTLDLQIIHFISNIYKYIFIKAEMCVSFIQR